ncbi:MAG: rhodanese-like domain-containing protein [Coriobacteriaceae bacterium]
MAGFMVENLALGLVSQYRWDEVAKLPRDGSVQLIDIRTPAEFERGSLPGFRNIPLDELRERLDELDPALPVRLVCQSGLRSYVAARMLAGHGFADVSHLAGGLRF